MPNRAAQDSARAMITAFKAASVTRRLIVALIAVPSTFALVVAWLRSFAWPLWHDLPILLYAAFSIDRFALRSSTPRAQLVSFALTPVAARRFAPSAASNFSQTRGTAKKRCGRAATR